MKINAKHFGAAILTAYAIWLIFRYDYHFIDNANLIFHEAGHFIFGFFGDTIQFLGGTIMQLLIPLIIIIHFFRNSKNFEAACCGVWLGESLMNVAVYMSDAMAMKIPLIGGYHDWNWLFGRWGVLGKAESIGNVTNIIASVIIIISLIFIWKSSFRQTRQLLPPAI